MRTTELARQAAEIIALAKQKILPGQAAKMKSYQRQETTNLCLTKIFYRFMALKVKAIEKKIKFTMDENDPGNHVMYGIRTLLDDHESIGLNG